MRPRLRLGAAKLEEIIRLVHPEDITSCRVLERAGMRYPGTASCFGVGTSGSA